jgi:hypothetical protein
MGQNDRKTGNPREKIAKVLLDLMVFFGAVLLFSLEPLAGRLLTPSFGAVAHVWLTCLMFFQAMLFLGYLYVHLLGYKIGGWHLLLLLIPLINLPLWNGQNPDPGAPLLSILTILVFRFALPFFVLSTTAVIAQTWLFQSSIERHEEPYSLYAASNAGSFFALIGYAFLIEPLLGVRTQSLAWSILYIFYILIVLLSFFKLRPGKESVSLLVESQRERTNSLPKISYLRWILLSALPSAFLLASTNYITLEIGSFPFVWAIPLALYLSSFMVTFRNNGGVPRLLKIFWLELLLAGLSLYLLGASNWFVLLGHLGIFFAICLVSHGILYEIRPAGNHLTRFYLSSALGGWIGGAFVSLAAPFVFKGLFEFPTALILFGALFWWHRDKAFSAFWPNASRPAAWGRMLSIGLILFPIAAFAMTTVNTLTKFRHRNFYGTYAVVEKFIEKESLTVRELIHGRTLHGSQLMDTVGRLTPISYYYQGGPIFDAHDVISSPRQIAVVGLGSGTISAFARQDDQITYYEIDPDNEKIARTYFTYLNECKGKVRIITGDGRLLIQDLREDKTKYDIITIDAFTGDGIPTHLITKEAIRTYFERLKEKGFLLFHISNRFYDLRAVLKSTAGTLNLSGAMNEMRSTQPKDQAILIEGQCVALTQDSLHLKPLIEKGWIPFGKGDGLRDVTPWTDDYINILAAFSIKLKIPFL